MAEEAAAPAATETPATVAIPSTEPVAISVDQAAKAWADARAKSLGPAETPKDPQPRVNGKFAKFEGETNSAPEGADAAPDESPPSGETEEAAPAELPPIEPPKSWSKEDKELFAALPRETQERVSLRETERDSDFRRRQNEASEKAKALEAKEKAMEDARIQHERAATDTLQVLQQQQTAEFADIKTNADVHKLATEDPFRFILWQARQQLIAHQLQEVKNLNEQREKEKQSKFDSWSKEQDSAFEKLFPEFADKEKSGALRASITSYLTKEVGVPEDVLPKLWNTDLFRDAMWQRVVYDASRFHAAQQKAKSAAAVPKPPVLKPGVSRPKGQDVQEALDAARNRLKGATGETAIRMGLDLLRAKRAASR